MNTPKVKLDDIIITAQMLHGAPPAGIRSIEQQGLQRIAEAMSGSPEQVIQMLCDLALEATGSDSTGVSWLLPDDEGFKWIALSGTFSPHLGGIVPRFHSPCGTVLSRNAPQLFSHPERYFEWLQPAQIAVSQGLVIPFYSPGGEPRGTFWAVTHDEQHRYQWNDAQLITSFAAYASSALKILGWYDEVH